MRCGIDRACQDLSGILIGFVGIAVRSVFLLLSPMFFFYYLAILGGAEEFFKKKDPGIDRAHRVLLGIG
jgi:hypothetical protein